jgi:hypothetical protein
MVDSREFIIPLITILSIMNDEQSALDEIKDAEKYAQRRRIQQILDSREDVRNMLGKHINSSDISEARRRNDYFQQVQIYIKEVEPLRHQHPEYDNIWTEKDLGSYKPKNWIWKNEGMKKLVGIDSDEEISHVTAEPRVIHINGLLDFLAYNPIMRVDIKIRTRNHTGSGRLPIPFPESVTDTAYRTANMYLAKIGFSADPEE